jgi:TonB-dependent receptor
MQKTLPENRLIWFFNTRCRGDTGHLSLVFTIALMVLFTPQASSQDLEKVKIDVQLKEVTIPQALLEIQKQSGIKYIYGPDMDVYASRKVSISEKNISVTEATRLVLRNTNLKFTQKSDHLIIEEKKEEPATPKVQARVRPGTISGKIIDEDSGEPLIGSTVLVKNTNIGGLADIDGKYQVTLEPGTYDLEFRYVGYQSKLVQNVIINDGAITFLDVAMQVTSSQLGEVVITAQFDKASVEGLLAKQKNNISITNGISAEQIRLTPDNNAAQVLKRVSGVTVQNEKFVTIRGVSDRYNNVLINGASLPSTEPNRRNFSFDIVPSALVDNITINKTATPDLPGEFTGGLVQVNSKDVPEENFLSFQVGTGFNTASTGKDFVSLRRDKKAALGIIDEERKWFGDGRVMDQQQYIKYLATNDTANLRRIGARIPNRWQPYKYQYTPQRNYQLAGGINKHFGTNNSIGAIAAVTYLNEQFYEEGDARNINSYYVSSKRYRYNTNIGGLFNLAFKSGRHSIAWKNLYNNKYSDQYDDRYGLQISSGDIEDRTSEVILSNKMIHTRMEGNHVFFQKEWKFDWYGDYINFVREQPDGRFLAAIDDDYGDYNYRYNFSDISLFRGGLYASQLKEEKNNAGANLSIPFTVAGDKQLFKTGFAYSKRKADFDASSMRLIESNGYGNSTIGLPYYEIATIDAVKNGSLTYRPVYSRSETTGDRYTGEQQLKAGYGMLDLKIANKLRVTGGARYEDNTITLSTVFYNALDGNSNFKDSTYHETDWLPSLNLTYSITEKFNIRTAWSKTLARPDFVERSPYMYYDFTEQLEVTGQTALETSRIKNYDMRAEYYFTGNEVLSASVFYKDFSKPVERFYRIGTGTNGVEYRNLYSATALGFEIDIRKNFSFLAPTLGWLQNVYITANYTRLKGAISYEVKTDTSSYIAESKRPIQGLSPYIVNLGLLYQAKRWSVNAVYNRVGRRIVNGGTSPTLVQYENPRDVIDLQLNLKLYKEKLEFRFNVTDLLNQPYIVYSNNANDKYDGNGQPIGDYVPEVSNNDPKGDAFNDKLDFINYRAKRGTNFSITIGYKW